MPNNKVTRIESDFKAEVETILINFREALETESFKFWFKESITNDTFQRNSYDHEQKAITQLTNLIIKRIKSNATK